MPSPSASAMLEIIRQAITTQTRLELEIIYSTGKGMPIDFDPYIYGEDTLQHYFLLGYLPRKDVLYKFRLTDILKAKLLTHRFVVVADAETYYRKGDSRILSARNLSQSSTLGGL